MKTYRIPYTTLLTLAVIPLNAALADPLHFSGWEPGAADTSVSEWNQNFVVTDRGAYDNDGLLDSIDDVIIANTSSGTTQESELGQRSSIDNNITLDTHKKIRFLGNIDVEATVALPGTAVAEGITSVLVQLESSIANPMGYLITVNDQQPLAFDFYADGKFVDQLGFGSPKSRAWARFELPGASLHYSVKVKPKQQTIYENLHSLRIDTVYTPSGPAPVPVIGTVDTSRDFPAIMETFESEQLSGQFSGSWKLSSAAESGGSQSLASGDINDNQTSLAVVEAEFEKPGNLLFDMATDTEENYDYLVFYVDDQEQARYSGYQPWTKKQFQITAGKHKLAWAYTKDYSVSTGADRVWIDNLEFEE